MRDIRSDLKERLEIAENSRGEVEADYKAAIKAAEDRFRQRTAIVEREIAAIRSLLDIETRRSGSTADTAVSPSLPIKEFFVNVVRGSGPTTKPQLRDLADAAGYFKSGENPGRTTHGHVQSLVRQGVLIKKGDTYGLPPDTAGFKF